MAQKRITVDPNRMRGLPSIRDTRVTVSAVLGQLAASMSIDDLLADYPYWNARTSSLRSNTQQPLRRGASWQWRRQQPREMADLRIDPKQAWFWTCEWQQREREADEDLAAGRIVRTQMTKQLLAALDERTKPLGVDA